MFAWLAFTLTTMSEASVAVENTRHSTAKLAGSASFKNYVDVDPSNEAKGYQCGTRGCSITQALNQPCGIGGHLERLHARQRSWRAPVWRSGFAVFSLRPDNAHRRRRGSVALRLRGIRSFAPDNGQATAFLGTHNGCFRPTDSIPTAAHSRQYDRPSSPSLISRSPDLPTFTR